MTPGAWILLASLLLALGFGLWRAYADGRFRGTHAIKHAAAVEGSRQARPPLPDVEVRAATPDVEVRAQRASKRPAPLLPADQLGERATLLQFSSAFCAPCRATRRILTDVAETVPGVAHVEIDAEHHLDLVRRVNVLRTPTTLVLDATGREVTRASGAPRKEQVLSALAAILDRPHGGHLSHDSGLGGE